MIGVKEGAAVGITAIIDSDTTDDSNVKGVDEYTLAELVAAAITGANRPATRDVLDQLQEALGMIFYFSTKKIVNNVQQLRAKASHLVTYGITMDNMQVTNLILANIDEATKHEYGHVSRAAIQTIRRNFT